MHIIERLRLERSWTRKELCRRSGVAPGTIRALEEGRDIKLQAPTINKLAGAFELPVVEFAVQLRAEAEAAAEPAEAAA